VSLEPLIATFGSEKSKTIKFKGAPCRKLKSLKSKFSMCIHIKRYQGKLLHDRRDNFVTQSLKTKIRLEVVGDHALGIWQLRSSLGH